MGTSKVYDDRAREVQSSSLRQKIAVRRTLAAKLELGESGAIYLPYCGDGELYAQVEQWWPAERVYAADRDVGACRRFGERWPDAEVVTADVTKEVEFPPELEFVIADFDAYGSPHLAVERFKAQAQVAKRFGVAMTDGSPRSAKIQGRVWDFRRGRAARFDREAADEQLNSWGELRRDWLAFVFQGTAEVVDTDWNKNKTTFYGSFVVDCDPEKKEEAEEAALPPEASADAIQELLNAHWRYALEDQDTARFCLALLRERMKLEALALPAPSASDAAVSSENDDDWMDGILDDE